MELKQKDKKLLNYLYHHYRQPFTEIGKRCRLSRDQVEYTLNKYELNGVIKKYLTIFNYNLLGYKEFIIVWLKTIKNKEQIKRELERMKDVISVGEISTKYDLFVNFIFKDKQEFEEIFYNFIKEHEIKEYEIFLTTYSNLYQLKQFGLKIAEDTYNFVGNYKKRKLDEKEIEILKELEKNGRVRIIDISLKTGISSELIIYKMKQLYKDKIILGTRIQFDFEKIGFYLATLRLKLKNQTKEEKEKINQFCKDHPLINALAFGISDYNCLIQILYRKEDELRKTLMEIKDFLKENLEDSFLLLIQNETKARTLPY
ncbi:Lrp/AsnC family transcriptional regulator [Candidatus Pacearchaeota archaeon]|nr:Lrp/AsnC family transcriptional regulator [Candidatus Pacearchaeota archaeon]